MAAHAWDAGAPGGAGGGGHRARPRVWYNPELQSTQFLVPGLIGFILMLTAVISTALSVVREKERGRWSGSGDRAAHRPAHRGKGPPYLGISLAATAVILLTARVLFGVEVRGSYLALFAATLLYLVGALSFGLLVSSFSDSQAMAFQVGAVSSMLPAIFLSGFIFPIRGMPHFLQYLTYAVPARPTWSFSAASCSRGPTSPLRPPHALPGAVRHRGAGRGQPAAWPGARAERVRALADPGQGAAQLRHDRRMIPVMIVGPLVQLFALGFAANTDVQHLPMLLVDLDRTEDSRRLVDRFLGSGYFDLVGVEATQNAIEPWLISGKAEVALVIERGYGADLARERTAQVQIIADGTNSNSAVVGLGYASRIVAAEGAPDRGAARAAPEWERPGRTDLRPRVWYNPDLKSRWFYVPAITALTLMLLTLILPPWRWCGREIGTLEQISVTPIRPWQLILGKLLPFGFIGLVNVCLVTAAARLVFGVPFRGSFPLLLLLTLPFLVAMLGLGLFASTLVTTQQQSDDDLDLPAHGADDLSLGLIFPIENMPHAIQLATYAIPPVLQPRDPRAVPQGLGSGRAVARGSDPGGVRRPQSRRGQPALPEEPGLKI